jgi:uncharacterized protein YqjF (DUF2071 family)
MKLPTSFGMPPSHDGRRVGRQRWRDLLFLHQPVPVETLRRLVPRRLEIDTYDGTAWATLIPFAVFDSRPIGVPRRLAMDFLEVNLRTYVRSPDGEAGIYFFSLEASSWLAVAGARLGYALPYFPAAMARQTDGDATRIDYRSRRRPPGSPAGLEVVWRVGPSAGTAVPDSLDHFLIERYVLFSARGDHLYRARVRHKPYPLCAASLETLRESLFAPAGLPGLSAAPLLHHSPGVDVEICWRRRLN